MSKVIVAQFLSLDGVCQAPGGSDEDIDGGFPYGGWQMPYVDKAGDEFGDIMAPVFDNMGAMLLGRKTYDIFASYWPHQDKTDNPVAAVMNSVPIYVASRSDTINEWKDGDVTLLKDLSKEVNELRKGSSKDIVVWGSSDLVQSLLREHLVDELRLYIHPLILGTGKKFFRDDLPQQAFELISSTTTSNGIVALTYKAL